MNEGEIKQKQSPEDIVDSEVRQEQENKGSEQAQKVSVSQDTTDIYGHKLSWYWKQAAWAVLVLALYEVALSFTALIPMLGENVQEFLNATTLPAEVFVFGWLGWRVVRREKEGWHQAAVTGAVAGMGLGLMMAVFKLILFRQVWAIFNIVTEPVFTAIVGVVVAGAVGMVLQNTKKKT